VFEKTCNSVMKKADMAMAAIPKVNASLSPEYLVHMVDLSVASKYRADITQFTRVVAENMRSTLVAFKQDLNSCLPKQVRVVVQQLNGE
jgi:hypothetical protein